MELTKEQYKDIYLDLETDEILMQLEVFMRFPHQIEAAHEVLAERGLTKKEIKKGRKAKKLPTTYSRIRDWILAPLKIFTWKSYLATYDTLFEGTATTKTGDQLFTNQEELVKHEYIHTFRYSVKGSDFRALYKSSDPKKYSSGDRKRVLYNSKTPEKSIFFPYLQLVIYFFFAGVIFNVIQQIV